MRLFVYLLYDTLDMYSTNILSECGDAGLSRAGELRVEAGKHVAKLNAIIKKAE